MFVFLGQNVFVIPEVDKRTPVSTNLNEVFMDGDVKDKTQLVDKATENIISEQPKMTPIEETKSPVVNFTPKRAGNATHHTRYLATNSENKSDVLSVLQEVESEEDNLATEVKDEQNNKEAIKVKSSLKDLDTHTPTTHNADRNGELAFVNGVHEDSRFTETNLNENVAAKPELVTVKEGYNVTAPKQKIMLVNESRDNVRLINDVLPNEKNVELNENESRQQQQRKLDAKSGLLPLKMMDHDMERGADKFYPETTTDENTRTSAKVDDSNKKLQTSLELSDIPLSSNELDAVKDNGLNSLKLSSECEPEKSAQPAVAERPQKGESPLQNNQVNGTKNGGETDIVNQSQDNKMSRDIGQIVNGGKPETLNQWQNDIKSRDDAQDSPWILQLPVSAGEQNKEKGSNERNNKRKRSAENRTPDQVIPRVMIEESETSKPTKKGRLQRAQRKR